MTYWRLYALRVDVETERLGGYVLGERAERKVKGSGATDKALKSLRFQITSGDLLPGEQIRQEEMAAQLGISRVPLREALGILADLGMVDHRRNQGYFVVKRARSELLQLGRMLYLLENELMQSLSPPLKEALVELERLHVQMEASVHEEDWTPFLMMNREFHFRIFELSPHRLIFGEVQRLWLLAEPHIALKLATSEERERAVREHAAILNALKSGRMDDATAALNEHRQTPGGQLTRGSDQL